MFTCHPSLGSSNRFSAACTVAIIFRVSFTLNKFTIAHLQITQESVRSLWWERQENKALPNFPSGSVKALCHLNVMQNVANNSFLCSALMDMSFHFQPEKNYYSQLAVVFHPDSTAHRTKRRREPQIGACRCYLENWKLWGWYWVLQSEKSYITDDKFVLRREFVFTSTNMDA